MLNTRCGSIGVFMCALIACLVVCCISAPYAQEKPSRYLDTASQVIKENNQIDADITTALQTVSLRPIHRVERLQKANKDAYAMWPDLFNSQVPDKYADLYVNLKKLVKLQMKRTCLIYDAEYTTWMVHRDKAAPYAEELKRVDGDYQKQKTLVNWIYDKSK